MHVIFATCMIVVCIGLLVIVAAIVVDSVKNIIKYSAEERIEEMQERHAQEMYMKNKYINYLEYCCAHPCIEIHELQFKEELDD